MADTAKELQKSLTWEFPHIAKEAPAQTEEAAEYCEGYKAFLNKAKTEREFVTEAVKNAGLTLVEVTKQGEWVSVTARKN